MPLAYDGWLVSEEFPLLSPFPCSVASGDVRVWTFLQESKPQLFLP